MTIISSRTDMRIWIDNNRADLTALGSRYVEAVLDQIAHSDHPAWGADWSAWLEEWLPGLITATVDGLDALDGERSGARMTIQTRGGQYLRDSMRTCTEETVEQTMLAAMSYLGYVDAAIVRQDDGVWAAYEHETCVDDPGAQPVLWTHTARD